MPSITIGFVILSHNNPRQLARLIHTLNRVYGNPPIICHHDVSQSAISSCEYPSNVSFVAPSYRTGWGKWSVVLAMLAALRLLYRDADPDWFVLLSASDYPIASAEHVLSELAASKADALIDYRRVGENAESAAAQYGPRNPTLGHYESLGNQKVLSGRYLSAELWLPIVRLSGPHSPRIGRHTLQLPFESPNNPFTLDFLAYCGDHWFSGSKATASGLLNPTLKERQLQKYLRWRTVPEECYYQTVLCNRAELTVQRDTRRFAQWKGGGAHPATLTSNDLVEMLSSGAHFAGKFNHNDPVLDRIDDSLLNRAYKV
jgi:hypothetical protein